MSPSSHYPSIPVSPRHLTGDGPGLREFVDRFDVYLLRLIQFFVSRDIWLTAMTDRCSSSIAMVRDIPAFHLDFTSYLKRTSSIGKITDNEVE